MFTQRGLIREVLARWEGQYPEYAAGSGDPNWRFAGTRRNLLRLDLESATAAGVDAAIGNSSWTDISCDSCGQSGLAAAVQVGQVADYESATAVLCLDCAERAVRELRAAL